MVTVCVINHEQDQAVVYRWLHQTEYDTLNGKTSVNIWREELELLKLEI